MSKFFVHSGNIKTGKTTRLIQWASSQKNIDGIFQPVINDKRFIYHLSSKTLKILETTNENNSYRIGKYLFNKTTFDWAKNILVEGIEKKLDWLVVDEVGLLELDGKGLAPVISEIISKKEFNGKIIFVVRQSLFERFITYYKLIDQYEIFSL